MHTLCRFYGIKQPTHRAMADVRALCEVMEPLFAESGHTMEDLLQAHILGKAATTWAGQMSDVPKKKIQHPATNTSGAPAPSLKSTAAPSLKSTVAPSLKSTAAPSLKPTASGTVALFKQSAFCMAFTQIYQKAHRQPHLRTL